MARLERQQFELLTAASIEFAYGQEEPRAANALASSDETTLAMRYRRISKIGGGIAITAAADHGSLSDAETLVIADFTLSTTEMGGDLSVDRLHYDGHGVSIEPSLNPIGDLRELDGRF